LGLRFAKDLIKEISQERENGAKRSTRAVTLTCDIQSAATSFTMHPTTYKAKAYSAASETSPLTSTTIPRRDPSERDVQIEILFCGICHSDLHSVRNEWSEFMAISSRLVAWSTPTGPAQIANVTSSNSAQT
jgi:hypothetical protein